MTRSLLLLVLMGSFFCLYASDDDSDNENQQLLQVITTEQPNIGCQIASTVVSWSIGLLTAPLGALLFCTHPTQHIWDCFDAVDDCNLLHEPYVAHFRPTPGQSCEPCFVCCPCLYEQECVPEE